MSCAQCENAEATVWCEDEGLDFCSSCSAQLHGKKARQHHNVVPLVAPPLCDECEVASAKVECLDCGGQKHALVFCLKCSASLHSRAARAAHQLVFIQRGGRQDGKAGRQTHSRYLGKQESVGGRIVIDLTELEDDLADDDLGIRAENGSKEERKRLGKVCVKEEVIGKANAKEAARQNSPPTNARVKKESVPKGIPKEKLRGKSLNLTNPSDQTGSEFTVGIKNVKEEKKSPAKSSKRRAQTGAKKLSKPSSVEAQSSSSEAEGDRSGSETNESDREYGGVHRIKRGSVSFEAFVVDANDQEEAGPPGGTPEGSVQVGIKQRIRKMLDLGLHPDTPDIEAQQALKNAQRLLTKHNLQQAEVLRGNLTDTSSLTGGMRVVELRTTGKRKQGRFLETWVLELGWVIADNFDCQYFTQAGYGSKPLTVVFYGISHNADCAGYAFAATFNRITKMSAVYVITQTCDESKENRAAKAPSLNQSTFTRVARTNYRKGVVAGLKEAVKSAQKKRKENVPKSESKRQNVKKEQDEAVKKEYEAKQKQPEEAKQTWKWPGYKTSSDEDEEDDYYSASENEGGNSPKDWKPKCEPEDGIDIKTQAAERCMAITALVMHSQKVGEEFLKKKGIKLRKRPQSCRPTAWNEEAFAQGKKDSETIDINQRGIAGSKVKKPRA